MKVAFFSETGDNKKYPKNFPNSRTEVAWCLALDAPMCSLHARPQEHFDLGIVIIPKEQPKVSLDYIRGCCDKVAVMQEGPHWYFQDYEIDKQFHYYNCLMEADWVYCHNESDVSYYRGLGCKDVRVMRSLMIPEDLIPRNEWGDATIIGGNFVSWYGGFDSYIVGKEFHPEYSLHCVSMGRKQQMEEQIEDIIYTPYVQWREWINVLSQYHVGIHLMPTVGAGTFNMNCAFHGIPCIGYDQVDTQRDLHPLTSVKNEDVESARHIAEKLKNDDGFYQECSIQSRELWEKLYSEEVFLEHMNKVFGSL